MQTVLKWISDVAPDIYNNNSADKINTFISVSKAEIDQSYFSDQDTYNLAVAYYTSHLLHLSGSGGVVPGALISEKEGDLSRTYADTSDTTTGVGVSQYLEMFNNMIRARIPNFYISK